MDIWVVSTFWLLWNNLSSASKPFSEYDLQPPFKIFFGQDTSTVTLCRVSLPCILKNVPVKGGRGRKVGVRGFPSGSDGKESACNSGDPRDVGSIPGLGRSPGEGNGNPLQCSCLENHLHELFYDRRSW